MSRSKRMILWLAVMPAAVIGLVLGTTAVANAYTRGVINMNGACANLANRYSYQFVTSYETRLGTWGSSSSYDGCWRLYTAGGENMTVTVRITNKNTSTGVVSKTVKAYKGVRSLSEYMNTCKHRITIETWANAGFGEEYLIAELPKNC